MAKIAFVNDLVVPVAVAAVNIGVAEYDARQAAEKMKMEPIVGIVGLGAGYLMQAFDKQPVVGNRIAVASMVPALRGIYTWVREAVAGGAAGTRITARRKVGSPISSPSHNPGIAQDPLRRYRQGGL